MSLTEFKSWLEGDIAGGGKDIADVQAKLAAVMAFPSLPVTTIPPFRYYPGVLYDSVNYPSTNPLPCVTC